MAVTRGTLTWEYMLSSASVKVNENILLLGSKPESQSQSQSIVSLICTLFPPGFFIFVATLVMAFGTLRASSFLHGKMLGRILRAPLSFFDTTPVGRIINRFSKDTEVTDNAVPMVGLFPSPP